MEQELVGQTFQESDSYQSSKDKKQKKKKEKQKKETSQKKGNPSEYMNELQNEKLDLESNGDGDIDCAVDQTTPAAGNGQNHKKNHHQKVASLKNRDSARSTSATLYALDSSRVDTQLLKSEMPKLPLYLGSHTPILYFRSKPIFTIGPDWHFTLCLWLSILISGILLAENIAINFESQVWYYALYFIQGFLLFTFTLTALLNPGIATEKETDTESNQYLGICPLCEIVLDNTTFHCMDCRVCIRGYDHHCPWTSKCIGANNHLSFNAFLGFFAIYFIYSMTLSVVYAM